MSNCSVCNKELKRFKTGGFRAFCSANCCGKHHYLKDVDTHRARNRKWRKDNKIIQALYRARARAKRDGLDFDLGLEDLIVPSVCPVLGISVYYGTRGNNRHSPSVDRIDPKGGYVKGNVRVISNRANSLKSDATLKELELILADARENYGNSNRANRFGELEDHVDVETRQQRYA